MKYTTVNKNNNPKNQHFVPEVYLKGFQYNSNGDLFTLDYKGNYPKKHVKSYNKSAICHKENVYTLNRPTEIQNKVDEDPYYIEKNLFTYENKDFLNLILKFTNLENLTNSESSALIHFYFSIKQRNPIFKQSFIDLLKNKDLTNEYIENRGKELLLENNYSIDTIENVMGLVKLALQNKLENDESNSDLFLDNLINYENDDRTSISEFKEIVSKKQFKVFTTNPEFPFITSDNPGFSMNKESKVANTNYKTASYLLLPILPKMCFCVHLDKIDQNELTQKKIIYEKMDNEFVKQINLRIASQCNRHVYSNTKSALENLIK